jgi:hypothetical protein
MNNAAGWGATWYAVFVPINLGRAVEHRLPTPSLLVQGEQLSRAARRDRRREVARQGTLMRFRLRLVPFAAAVLLRTVPRMFTPSRQEGPGKSAGFASNRDHWLRRRRSSHDSHDKISRQLRQSDASRSCATAAICHIPLLPIFRPTPTRVRALLDLVCVAGSSLVSVCMAMPRKSRAKRGEAADIVLPLDALFARISTSSGNVRPLVLMTTSGRNQLF